MANERQTSHGGTHDSPFKEPRLLTSGLRRFPGSDRATQFTAPQVGGPAAQAVIPPRASLLARASFGHWVRARERTSTVPAKSAFDPLRTEPICVRTNCQNGSGDAAASIERGCFTMGSRALEWSWRNVAAT